ncbi:hypothetical protein CU669_20770 [Paramagnetospirillum kuznetsovii]|uniref:Uncharacterized protein n=1 Tax=Paramagnetospirillum kuznetsovii TaxID=2053833 RepID=A0A364NSY0_9PROT|nr:helix-turn-helix domain-containing protein [Paramagnetospirillum kuznetsovii]RAU19997.1 hypothetical protein CU669_20770 [Paramagnetospirillum kuznetsovii]
MTDAQVLHAAALAEVIGLHEAHVSRAMKKLVEAGWPIDLGKSGRHPNRFVRIAPQAPALPTAAWINPPENSGKLAA